MTEKFEVGEMAIVVGLPPPYDVLNNRECTVLSTLQLRRCIATNLTSILSVGHDVDLLPLPEHIDLARRLGYKEVRLLIHPVHLRKRPQRGDLDELVTWDGVGWRPNQAKLIAGLAERGGRRALEK